MARDERLNEEGAMNNNLTASTYVTNPEIRHQHKKPKLIPRKK